MNQERGERMKRGIRPYVLRMALGALCVLSLGAQAEEFRVPLLGNVKAHDFDPREMDSSLRFTFNNEYYSRFAHRCYMAHSINTDHLTALLFNKSDFRMSEIFTDALVSRDTEHYSPYMRVLSIQPRAYYSEQGTNLGFSAQKEILDGRALVGVRVSVPFKSVEFERQDAGSRLDSQLKDISVKRSSMIDGAGVSRAVVAEAYRLDFIEALPQNPAGDGGIVYQNGDTPNRVSVFAKPVTTDIGGPAVVYSEEGHVPLRSLVGILDNTTMDPLPLTPGLNAIAAETPYRFAKNTAYPLYPDEAAKTGAERVALQDIKANLWVSTVHQSGSSAQAAIDDKTPSKAIIDNATKVIQSYSENVYEWMHDRGYDFDTDRRVGFGDTDVEFFYEQEWGDRVTLEADMGFTLPTAEKVSADMPNTPYLARLGNNGHYVWKFGGKVAYEFNDLFCVSAGASYAYAFAAKELITGVAKDSFVKGIGPREFANVSWGQFVGDVKLNMVHPRTSDLSGSIGYQIFAKATDKVAYLNDSIDSWLGYSWDATAENYVVENKVTLSGEAAAANTQRIAHRATYNVTYFITDWINIHFGGAVTFAGKYVAQDLDFSGGCTITF